MWQKSLKKVRNRESFLFCERRVCGHFYGLSELYSFFVDIKSLKVVLTLFSKYYSNIINH